MTSPERLDMSCMHIPRDGSSETYIVRYTNTKNSSLFFRFRHIHDTYRPIAQPGLSPVNQEKTACFRPYVIVYGFPVRHIHCIFFSSSAWGYKMIRGAGYSNHAPSAEPVQTGTVSFQAHSGTPCFPYSCVFCETGHCRWPCWPAQQDIRFSYICRFSLPGSSSQCSC